MSDPWAAFGSDDDDSQAGDDDSSVCPNDDDERDEDEEVDETRNRIWHESLARCVAGSISVLGRLPMVSIGHTPKARLRVGCVVTEGGAASSTSSSPISERILKQLLKLQGVVVSDVDPREDKKSDPTLWDALLVIGTTHAGAPVDEAAQQQQSKQAIDVWLSSIVNEFGQYLVAGGAIIFVGTAEHEADCIEFSSSIDDDVWERSRHPVETPSPSPDSALDGTVVVVALTKRLGRIQHETCPWLSRTSQLLDQERARVNEATVPISAHEAQSHQLTEASIRRGVQALQSFGYCIVPRLLCPQTCRALGALALEDLHDAATILRRDHGVDLYHPGSITAREAGAYRELSLREDFRMDLRNGPRLDRVRRTPEHTYRPRLDAPGVDGNDAWVIRAETPLRAGDGGASTPFLRGHPDVLEIVRRCMNPPPPPTLDVSGNWGRFNFSSSRPGTYQDVRVGRVGSIVSLPGAADQALHADTPHLFEIASHLPPHYVNAFCPGAPSAPGVGQTALVHGSHQLDVASRMLAAPAAAPPTAGDKCGWHAAVVRPRLEPGDVLLFDCRILHFGLANAAGSSVERPILYTNMTLAWFHDPKNWDDQQRIFPTNEGDSTGENLTRPTSD